MSSEMGKDQSNLHPSAQLIRGDQLTPTPLSSDRGRQWQFFGPQDGSTIDLHQIELLPGSVTGQYHIHSSSECIYVVLAGTLEVRHPDGVAHLEPGDAMRLPPNVPHSAHCVSSTAVQLLEIYAPAPADFVRVEEDHGARRS